MNRGQLSRSVQEIFAFKFVVIGILNNVYYKLQKNI